MTTESKPTIMKQVLWFIALWCLGFFGLVVLSSIIRFMMSMAGLQA